MISQVTFLFVSGAEIGFILFVVLLVFGADKVPEIARGMGKAIRQVKDATNEIKSEITKGIEKQDMHEIMKRKHEALFSVMIPNHGPLHLPNHSYLIMNTD